MQIKTTHLILNQGLFWLTLLFTSLSWGQYNGTGTFTKITSANDLTSGYYVITDEDGSNLMKSTNPSNYYEVQNQSAISNQYVNPIQENVWKITLLNNQITIYSETTGKYVAFTGGGNGVHAITIEPGAIISNTAIWTFSYSSNKFTVKNKQTTSRMLKYNDGGDRFSCYLSTSQNMQNLQFYKLNSVELPEVVDQVFCGSATVSNLPQSNEDGIFKWYNTQNGGSQLNLSDNLATGNYYVSVVIGGVESARTAVVVTINEVATVPTVLAQTFCGSATVADLPQGNNTYKWYSALTGGSVLTNTTALVNGTYYVSTSSNGCESARTAVVVTINEIPAAPTVLAQTFCGSATVTDLPQGNNTYKWYSALTGGSVLANTSALVNGTYYVSTSSNGCESARTAVVVTINEVPTVPSVLAQTFCGSATVTDLPQNNGSYKWYSALTGGSVLANTSALVNGTYYVSTSLNGCESVRTAVAVTINQIPTAPTVLAQTFCGNATVTDLPQNNGSYKWYSALTGGSVLTNTTALVNGTYYVSTSSNGCESARTAVVVTINEAPTAPIVLAQAFCGSATVADLPQGNNTYKWYSALTGGSVLTNTTALANGTYYVSTSSNGCESARTAVVVTINEVPTAPTVLSQAFCGSATVADLPQGNNTYKWYSALTGGSVLTNTTALANGTYYVSTSSNGCESARTAVVVTINEVPTSPTVLAQTFCGSAIVADLPQENSFKWYATLTSTNALVSTSSLASGTYYVSTSSNGCESARIAVDVTINPIPAAPVISNQTFCGNATVANLVQGSSLYKWYLTEEGGLPLLNSTELVTGTYFASRTVNGCESARTAVVVTINEIPTAPIVLAQTFCGSATVADLPQGNNTYKWYSALTGGSVLTNTTALANGTYYVSRIVNGCESERIAVNVNIIILPVVEVNAIQTFCGVAYVSDLQAQGIDNAEILWYSSYYQTLPLAPGTPLVTGTYYVQQKIGSCSSVKKAVSVNISSMSAPLVNGFVFCEGARVIDLYIVAETGASYKWYASMNSLNELNPTEILSSGTYYVSKVKFGCESQRASVSVVIKDLPISPTGDSIQTFMQGAVINNLITYPSIVTWFTTENDARTLTNPLSPNMPLVQGATYYAVVIGTNACPSLPLAVTVNVTLGNNDFVKQNVKYYPNPILDYLTIDHTEVINQISVFNSLGQQVFSQYYEEASLKIDFSSFASDVYLIKIKTNTAESTIKVIKK